MQSSARRKWLASPLCVNIIVFLLLIGLLAPVAMSEEAGVSVKSIQVYIVSLNGVNGYGVDDPSRVVDGVSLACAVNAVRYWTGEMAIANYTVTPLYLKKYKEIPIDVNVTVISDWHIYREVVKSGCGVIIVNAHGETIPVPSDYTKEEWIDRIAEAMAYRNVTWVHMAGYPFYYYFYQESGAGVWAEAGFKRLMSAINLTDITCWPLGDETVPISMHPFAEQELLDGGWSIFRAYFVQRGRPLNFTGNSPIKNYLVLPIWGDENGYLTGAVIKFAGTAETGSFGIYVYVGGGQTYDIDAPPFREAVTDKDYYRGYVAAANAIFVTVTRVTAEETISDAQQAISTAESEGRTKGLDEARNLFQEAKNYYSTNWYRGAIIEAGKANEAAENAIKPSFIETFGIYFLISGVVTTTLAGTLIVRRRKNSRKKE